MRRRPNIFIFNEESLNNDEVILEVEDTPTYKRSKPRLNEIKAKANGNTLAPTPEKKEESGSAPGIISFI